MNGFIFPLIKFLTNLIQMLTCCKRIKKTPKHLTETWSNMKSNGGVQDSKFRSAG